MAKDWWDKAEIGLGKIVVPLSVPVVIGLSGYFINDSIQEKNRAEREKEHRREIEQKHREQIRQDHQNKLELSQKYIEIAVSILNTDPSKQKKDEPLRNWAIDILKTHSPVELTEAAIKALKERPLSINASATASGASVAIQAGQVTARGTNTARVKARENQTVPVFGGKISILLRAIEFADNANRLVNIEISAPGKRSRQFSSVDTDACLSYDIYSIRVTSISTESADLFVSDEKPCE